MALTLTVTVIPSAYAVDLVATGATGIVSWYRVESRDISLGNGTHLVDRGAPLNIPITYYAKDDLTTITAPPVTITSAQPILSSTMSGTAYPVTVVDSRPYDGQAASVWHPVIGRSDPFVSVFPAIYPAGELVLRCPRNDDRIQLIQFIGLGEPMLLRSTDPERIDSMTFLMTGWSDPRAVPERREGATYLTIQYQRVTEVTPAFSPPARTYADMLAESATYADVLTKYATYRDLLDGTVIVP